MGVRTALGRLAARHAHVLVVEAPGEWIVRAAVERAALGRGWRLALSPADADVLAVCGRPGPDLAGCVEQVWRQLPGPRVRIDIDAPDDAALRLDAAGGLLQDTARHQRDAREREFAPDPAESADDQAMNDDDDDDATNNGDDMGMDMDGGDDMDMDMDGGGMEMAPSGVPLAGGADDRDGLEMDVLHVRLGPVLPYWPAGLVLRCTLQGDVITQAGAQVLDAAGNAAAGQAGAARRVDAVVALLALAGWEDAAASARHVRDSLLAGDAGGEVQRGFNRLTKRVSRSRFLRRSLHGLLPLDEDALRDQGLAPGLLGDTHDRLLRLLREADRAIRDGDSDSDRERESGDDTSISADQIAQLVVGLDLAAARLVVASLGACCPVSVRRGGETHHW